MTHEPDPAADAVRRLLDADDISPAMRRSYQSELDAMLARPLTWRKAAPGIALLVILLVGVVALSWNLIMVEAEPLAKFGWLTLLLGFGGSAYLIGRDLWLKQHTKKSMFAVTNMIGGVAGLVTAVAVLQGMRDPADPASTFHVLFTLVFYIACLFWNLDSRIAAAELAAREQMLRIEYRLAELAERRRG